jgi:hypothetical protein
MTAAFAGDGRFDGHKPRACGERDEQRAVIGFTPGPANRLSSRYGGDPDKDPQRGRAMSITIPTIAAVSAALILAPAARADDPSHNQILSYLGCLKHDGVHYDDNNPDGAIGLVSGDVKSGIPRLVILSKLQSEDGLDRSTASAIMSCSPALPP